MILVLTMSRRRRAWEGIAASPATFNARRPRWLSLSLEYRGASPHFYEAISLKATC